MSKIPYDEEYSALEEAHRIAEDKEEYYVVQEKWFVQLPTRFLFDNSLSHSDWIVYVALDFLAGKRGYFYCSIDQLMEKAYERVRELSGAPLPLKKISRSSILRAIKKLRNHDYIRTRNTGLQMNGILIFYVMHRSPENPPKLQ